MPTTTIKSSGGDYTTVALWEADTDNDLSGVGEVIGEIYDVNTTVVTTIAGATNTSASDFRHLTTNSAHRHAGVWDTGKSDFQAGNSSAGAINLAEAFCKLSYVQVKNNHASPSAGIKIDNAASVKIEQCISWTTGIGGLADNAGVHVAGAGSTSALIRNTVCYSARCGVFQGNSAQTVTLQNSTLVGGVFGVRWAGTGYTTAMTNVYAGGNSGNDFDENGSAGWTSASISATTCMCEDSITETGLTNAIAFDTANFTNVTAGSVDVHLVTGSALIDQGTDLSGTFTVDINGNTRTGTWDVGADEFGSGGGAPAGQPFQKRLGGVPGMGIVQPGFTHTW